MTDAKTWGKVVGTEIQVNIAVFCTGGNTTLKCAFQGEFPNDKCQNMGNFNGEYKISGVLGD